MKLKKAVAIAAAAGALAAISVPAMAFENEFHGMYRGYGFFTNALSGGAGFQLRDKSETDKYVEQRVRLMYVAKASDNLKLVTHFELDTKWGGQTSTKYPIGDGGGLDADRLTLETKSLYLDFNIPSTTINAKIGVQPWRDALMDTYGLFDGTGAVFTGKFDPLTLTYGYFTVGNDNGTFNLGAAAAAAPATGISFPSNIGTKDLNILDAKFAITKDISIGSSYYMLLDKNGPSTLVNNTVGLNANAKIGPVTVGAMAGLQFGKENQNLAIQKTGTTAFAGALTAKIAVGPGKINASALFLSGDRNGNGYNHAWQSIGTAVNYFVPANMWLLTRHIDTINTSTAIGGSSDITRGGRGIMGVFGGYEGTAGKVFYSGNIGYAKVADKRTADSASIGTELNAILGYKLYDNLSANVIAAYAVLGDGYGKDTGALIPGGVNKADNPFMGAIALNYSF